MIYYLSTEEHSYTMRLHLMWWAGPMAHRIQLLSYDDLDQREVLPVGTYIFSDLDRVATQRLEWLTQVADRLVCGGARVLNRPSSVLFRYDLLRALYADGINAFVARRVDSKGPPVRFPVILRMESEHNDRFLELLDTQEALDARISYVTSEHGTLDKLLVVEYLDTSDQQGVFRKYSSFRVGGRILPARVNHSELWHTHDTTIFNAETLAEEWEYLRGNPHEEILDGIFQRAGIDYGCIDYGMLDGVPQVWEINTNPIIIMQPDRYRESILPMKSFFAAQFNNALADIDTDGSYSIPIST